MQVGTDALSLVSRWMTRDVHFGIYPEQAPVAMWRERGGGSSSDDRIFSYGTVIRLQPSITHCNTLVQRPAQPTAVSRAQPPTCYSLYQVGWQGCVLRRSRGCCPGIAQRLGAAVPRRRVGRVGLDCGSPGSVRGHRGIGRRDSSPQEGLEVLLLCY